MKKLIFTIAVVLTVGFTVTSCKSEQKETKEVVKEVEEVVEKTSPEMIAVATYQCPMDCEKGKTYDKPGQCPVCKMDLQKQEADSDSEEHEHEEGESEEHEG